MDYRIYGILLILLLFSACQDEEEANEIPLEFEKKRILKMSEKDCDTIQLACTFINLEVLKAKGPDSISQKINNILENHIITAISTEDSTTISNYEELTKTFISDYRRSAEIYAQEPPWEAYVNQSIYRKDDSLLSIGINIYAFRGGAHGYKNLSFLNFDPQSGDIITWDDIFTAEFKNYIEEKFRKEHDIPEGKNINSTGFWFKNDLFHLPSNIGFTEGKVILVYNTYEIAPYADGEFYMEVPLEELHSFVKIK